MTALDRMAKRKAKKQKAGIPRHVDRLYKAVAHYVEKTGGKVIVIGGIQVQKWPLDRAYTFTIGIRCTGRQPKFSEEPK